MPWSSLTLFTTGRLNICPTADIAQDISPNYLPINAQPHGIELLRLHNGQEE